METSDSDEGPKPSLYKELEKFRENVTMFERFKRAKLRRTLKNDKLRVLGELAIIRKKLKILDKLDKLDEEDKLKKEK